MLGSLLMLPACITPPPAAIEEIADEKGNVELILEAIEVWDDDGASEPQEYTVNDRGMTFRVRDTSFANAWVRLGLFWHSKQKRIHMPIVIAGGPPVTIQKVRLEAGRSAAVLRQAKNFEFTPGKRAFDKELYSATFTLSPKLLAKVGESDNVYVSIYTQRGVLRANLAVASGGDTDSLVATAKYQFSEFYRRWQQQQ